MSMAIVAGGDFGSHVRLAQCHGFSVVRIPVMSEAILVTSATALVAGHFKVAVLARFNLVRRMAVGAHRSAFVPPGQELPVNALVIGLLDLDVALAAGLCHVRRVDG